MSVYREWMDRQTVPELTHRRLLALEPAETRRKRGLGRRWGALAASLALTLGAAALILPRLDGGMPTRPSPVVTGAPTLAADPVDPLPADRAEGFLAQGPGESAKLMFPAVIDVTYNDVIHGLPKAKLLSPDGAFSVPLSREEILPIFWGPEGKPAVENPKADPGDFPSLLSGWAGYRISGQAIYDGQGDLWMLTLRGEREGASFTLTLCPGQIPPSCTAPRGLETCDVLGTEVTGWSILFDGQTDYEVGCSFMAGDYGVTFENVNAPFTVDDGTVEPALGGARAFNAMLVNYACRADGGFYLDPLLHNDAIPGWWSQNFDALADARACADFLAAFPQQPGFADYLPVRGPQGFGDFSGRLEYQEGRDNRLWVTWYRGYDTVEIAVIRPEGENTRIYEEALVDVTVPESYDWRLYDGSISDSVPPAYQQNFYRPTFRAQDMSPEVVEARGASGSYTFSVLHPGGVVVSYACSGVSAQFVWSLVEATL